MSAGPIVDVYRREIGALYEAGARYLQRALTDCGFGTSAGFGKLDPDIAFL